MAPSPFDLEPWRETIQGMVEAKETQESICQRIEQDSGRALSPRTLRRRMTMWNINYFTRTQETDNLRDQICETFRSIASDAQNLKDLTEGDGELVSLAGMRRLRREMGLYKRWTPQQAADMLPSLENCLRDMLDGVRFGPWGRARLSQYMRYLGWVGRDRVYNTARLINPTAVATRSRTERVHKGDYASLDGPNHVWSMDGYMKFQYFGIEIYAAIDAYSRYITWIYIGKSARTQYSVAAQYLKALDSGGVMPRVLRSDRGSETELVADLHYTINSRVYGQMDFHDCFSYGTSQANQRIEAWWNQLARGCTHHWRKHFCELKDCNLFCKDVCADRIAFLAIYMPIIREEVLFFTNAWNQHCIRRQPNRRNHVHGVPHRLYHYSEQTTGAPNVGTALDRSDLEEWQVMLNAHDLDEYLPPATLDWCKRMLLDLGFPDAIHAAQVDVSGEWLHIVAYLALRREARAYCESGGIFQETALPEKPQYWRMSLATQAAYRRANEPLQS